jgi:hypothetical protein
VQARALNGAGVEFIGKPEDRRGVGSGLLQA